MRTPTLLAGGLIAAAAALLIGWALLADRGEGGPGPGAGAQGASDGPRIDVDAQPGAGNGGGGAGQHPGSDPDSPTEDPAITVTPDGPDSGQRPAFAGARVRVVDTREVPLPGVLVEPYAEGPGGDAGNPPARTDAEGRCQLPSSGVYRFSSAQHATAIRSIGLDTPADEEVTITLLARRELRGVVLGEGGRPLVNAEVSAESGSWTASTLTDADGAFRFVDAPVDEPTLFHVSAPEHVAQAFDEGDLPQLSLERGGVIVGRVVDSSGAPLVGARVRVFTADRLQGPAGTLTADAEGGFSLGGLSPTELVQFEVLGDGEGLLSEWAAFDPEPRLQTAPLGSLVLEGCPAGVQITVSPLEQAIASYPQLGENPLHSATGPGEVRFPALIPGTYMIAVTPSERAQALEPLAVGSGETRLPFTSLVADAPAPDGAAPPSGTQRLRVRVVDANGSPVAWAQVFAIAGPVSASRSADARGECAFSELPRAPVLVSASAAGRVLHSPVTYDPERDSGEQVTVVLSLPTVLSGSIGAPARPLLRLRPPDHPEEERVFEGSPDGRFRWGGLPPGTWELEVGADGYVAQELTITLPLSRDLDLRLEEWHGHDHAHEGDHEDH